jgi:hypothetical protein
MSKIDTFNSLRIIPRDAEFLNRTVGRNGDIYFDRDARTLRLYNGATKGGISLAKEDLSNISNQDFLAKATASGITVGGSFSLSIAADDSTIRTISPGNVLQFVGSNGISTSSTDEGVLEISNTSLSFSTIAVAGQASVVAETVSDTLTLVAGSNISIATDATTDTITINSTGGIGSNTFANIAVSGQTTLEADTSTDTLTLVSGSGITISTNALNDSITIASTVTSITAFSSLTDASAATLTVDKFYLPAMTMLVVSNNGASAYRFDQYGSTDNPTIFAITGMTIAFDLNATGHPFLIQTPSGVNYNTGLIHVSPSGTVSTGSAAQGKDAGTLYWKVPTDISGGYRYQCSLHAPMVGSITVKTINTI